MCTVLICPLSQWLFVAIDRYHLSSFPAKQEVVILPAKGVSVFPCCSRNVRARRTGNESKLPCVYMVLI